jgi:hypothetical protein
MHAVDDRKRRRVLTRKGPEVVETKREATIDPARIRVGVRGVKERKVLRNQRRGIV